MSTVPSHTRGVFPARAADEFVLVTAMLFLAVTAVRWLRDPGSVLCVADLDVAITVIGAFSGTVLTVLILTPPGRRSGGHMNPAVTVSLWLMGAFPGRGVLPYVLAQLAGSAAGTGLARLAWGRPVALPSVDYAAIGPAPAWQPSVVFLAEAGGMAAIVLVVGFLMARTRFSRLLPYAIGLSVALVITLLGTRSGGSVNPARQLGPAVLAGRTEDLWIYLVAPVLGAALGAWLDRLLGRLRRRLPSGGTRVAASAHPSGEEGVPAFAVNGHAALGSPGRATASPLPISVQDRHSFDRKG
ncbi:MIP/aquaporin family protein [Streptomyces sp. NPDC057950]|uniref:MIP/aquaporin family protein n=1 Tax=Streptomyces sp. NPDC057950 TaxID=3346288 RepID=UPI0036E0E87B